MSVSLVFFFHFIFLLIQIFIYFLVFYLTAKQFGTFMTTSTSTPAKPTTIAIDDERRRKQRKINMRIAFKKECVTQNCENRMNCDHITERTKVLDQRAKCGVGHSSNATQSKTQTNSKVMTTLSGRTGDRNFSWLCTFQFNYRFLIKHVIS